MRDVIKKGKKCDRTHKTAKHQQEKVPASLFKRKFIDGVDDDEKSDQISKKNNLDRRHIFAQILCKCASHGKHKASKEHIKNAKM